MITPYYNRDTCKPKNNAPRYLIYDNVLMFFRLCQHPSWNVHISIGNMECRRSAIMEVLLYFLLLVICTPRTSV